MKFEIYSTEGEWRWRLKASNGKVLASGEGYKRKIDCLKAIRLVRGCRAASEEILT